MSLRSIILSGAIATLARAFSPPTDATWGALLTPDLSSTVTQGKTFEVTWDPASHPTEGVTVSLVLCHGPSNNCVTSPTAIVEGVPAALKSYSWAVPCDLAAGTKSTDTGYGMLIIVDGTGEFQYSTQFSVLSSPSCSSSTTSAPANSSSTSTSSATGEVTAVSIGPGQGGFKNATTTAHTTTAAISAPSSIVSASGFSAATVSTTQSYASASASATASTSSGLSGAGMKVQIGGLFGLVVGALAMLTL